MQDSTRRASAAGFILNAASQRPDADSVPAKLREIITYRCCTQVVDRISSDMVVGKGTAAQDADISILSENHKPHIPQLLYVSTKESR